VLRNISYICKVYSQRSTPEPEQVIQTLAGSAFPIFIRSGGMDGYANELLPKPINEASPLLITAAPTFGAY